MKTLILAGFILFTTSLSFAVDVTLDLTAQQITTITNAHGWDASKGTRVDFLKSVIRRLVGSETAYIIAEQEHTAEKARIERERVARERQVRDELGN